MSAKLRWTVDEDGPDGGPNWWTVGNDQTDLMFSTEEQDEAEWLRDTLNSHSELLEALQSAERTERLRVEYNTLTESLFPVSAGILADALDALVVSRRETNQRLAEALAKAGVK